MIKGILFDKDGTLIEFTDIWAESFVAFLKRFEFDNGMEDEVKRRVGIDENFQVLNDSILAAGTIKDLALVLKEYSSKSTEDLEKEISEFFFERLKENPEKIKGLCNIKKLFKELTESGYKVGVVTADSYPQSRYTFEYLDCLKYISFIATGDRYPNKPNPESLDKFCSENELNRKEVAFVGDSLVDVEYGNLAGLSIGIERNSDSRENLSGIADFVVKTPCEIIDILKNINN